MIIPLFLLSFISSGDMFFHHSHGHGGEMEMFREKEIQDIISETVYKIEVNVAVIGEETLPIWHTDLTRETKSGSPVHLSIKKDKEFLMKATLLPYSQNDHSVMMVIRGGIWLAFTPGKIRYRSIFHTIPLRLSVPVRIQPLGYQEERWQKFFPFLKKDALPHNIEITIKVMPD